MIRSTLDKDVLTARVEDEGGFILCSGCYDDSGADGFNAIIPGSHCIACERHCLGYQLSRPETTKWHSP